MGTLEVDKLDKSMFTFQFLRFVDSEADKYHMCSSRYF